MSAEGSNSRQWTFQSTKIDEQLNLPRPDVAKRLGLKDNDLIMKEHNVKGQIALHDKLAKEVKDFGVTKDPGRFYEDPKALQKFLRLIAYRVLILRANMVDARNQTQDPDLITEMDGLIKSLEVDQQKMAGTLSSKDKIIKIYEEYLAKRIREGERQRSFHEKKKKKLEAFWDTKLENVRQQLKFWKDEAEFKHGDMKKRFEKEAAELVAASSESAAESNAELIESEVEVQRAEEEIQGLGEKGMFMLALLNQVKKAADIVKMQVTDAIRCSQPKKSRDGQPLPPPERMDAVKLMEEMEELCNRSPRVRRERKFYLPPPNEEKLNTAAIRVALAAKTEELQQMFGLLDRKTNQIITDHEFRMKNIQALGEQRIESINSAHERDMKKIKKQGEKKWEAREAELKQQADDLAEQLDVPPEIEEMIKSNQNMAKAEDAQGNFFKLGRAKGGLGDGTVEDEVSVLQEEKDKLVRRCNVLRNVIALDESKKWVDPKTMPKSMKDLEPKHDHIVQIDRTLRYTLDHHSGSPISSPKKRQMNAAEVDDVEF